MAAAVLHVAGRGAEIEKRFGLESRAIAAMLAKNLNCPPSSSMGRVFDAAAGLLGLCTHMQYEAQAAMLLEQAASRHIDLHGWPEPLAQGWTIDGQNRLDLLPLLAYLDGAADVDHAAAVFHATLVAALSDWVDQAGRTTGVKTLIWGGGCWLNSLLSSGMRPNMEQSGLTLLAPVRSPPGDGAIALGQAWVAMNQLEP
jgi:hydrogenase maturation protein HypF